MPRGKKSSRLFLFNDPHAVGGHRSVYAQRDTAGVPTYVTKVAHSHFIKSKGLWRYRIPMKWHALRRYWRRDINQLEVDNYTRYFAHAPVRVRDCLARVLGIEKSGESLLHMEAVRDYDDSLSLSLAEMGKVSSPLFWRRFDEFAEWMIQKRIPFFDFNPTNFMVQFTTPTTCIPVLVDYKNASLRPYPLQPWLHVPSFAAQKIRRKYARLKKKFQG